MMKTYMDIDIGCAEIYQHQQEAYKLAVEFLNSVGQQFGWPARTEDLSEEAKELVHEVFANDPVWSSKGSIKLEPPVPLRAGRIVIELFAKECPKAAENFRALCTGEKGTGRSSRKSLHYKGCRFHRVVKGFVCQGGDIVKGDGSAGDSIYGGHFNDDKPGLKMKHNMAGIVGMANSGRKNTNTSQFYFTLAPAPKCDGLQVIFGRVVEGLDILQRIELEAASSDGNPKTDVVIADCGVLHET